MRSDLLADLLRHAPPPEAATACLLWRDGRGEVHARTLATLYLIGRDPSCDVVLASARVFRRRCVVREEADGIGVTDLDSANGVLVNGEVVRIRMLCDGDVIEIGGTAVVYVGCTERRAVGGP